MFPIRFLSNRSASYFTRLVEKKFQRCRNCCTASAVQKSPQDQEAVIGLEVHAQIISQSKLFSTAATEYISQPNSQVDYFDLSLPGTLPVLNRHCVEVALRTALALNCTIPGQSSFDRKHYFYGDMPNGYQITQQRNPIAINGWIDFIVFDEFYENQFVEQKPKHFFEPYIKRCRLKQIQLEQDSGKSLTDEETNQSLIDLNRAGVPLMELVFEPDLHSPIEATSLVRELILTLRAIEACSCRMQEGALRVDANVSIRPKDSPPHYLATRTEIKNLNSLRFIREAILYEFERQNELAKAGQPVINETMGYNMRTKTTFSMRDKEIVQDYRFMPEPNLPPILLRDSDCDSNEDCGQDLIDISPIRNSLPELPTGLREKLLSSQYSLSLGQIFLLLNDQPLCKLFFEIHNHSARKNGDEIVQFFIGTFRTFAREKSTPEKCISYETITAIVSSEYLAQLIDLKFSMRISEPTVIDVLSLYLQCEKQNPESIVERFNWWLITDEKQIEQVCQEVVRLLPKIARNYAKKGVRKPKSMLIQHAQIALGNQVNEDVLWKVYDRILRNK